MDKTRMLLPLAWRNLWRNPRRTIVTLAVVSVGLYSVLVLGSLLDAWAQSSRNASLNLLIGSGQIHAKGYLDDPTVSQRMEAPSDALLNILESPEINSWASRVRVPSVIQSEYKTLPVTLLGVEPQSEFQISTLPHQIVEGRYLSAKDDVGIVLGNHLAKRLKTRVGKRVVIMAQSEDGSLAERAYQVVGLFSGNQNAEDSYAFTGIEIAQTQLDIGNDISEISFSIDDDKVLAKVLKQFNAVASELDIASWKELAPLVKAIDAVMRSMTFIWLFVICAFICIGIVNTQLMAVFERVREFGLLQAIGMQSRLVLLQVILESAILIGVGVITSITAATVTITLLDDGIDLSFFAQGAEYFGAGHILYPQLSPALFLTLSSAVFAIGVAITLWPAYRASCSNPVEAMRHA